MPKTESKQQIRVRGEDLVCAELERQGLQVLDRNLRCQLGEIDIVAADTRANGLTLVFCEVKCRSGLGSGHSIWMHQHPVKASTIRLDPIGVVLMPGNEPSLTHVRAVG